MVTISKGQRAGGETREASSVIQHPSGSLVSESWEVKITLANQQQQLQRIPPRLCLENAA